MAVVRNVEFSNFLIFKFLVTNRVGTTNVHRHTTFIKIDQIIAEISHLTNVKMVALCHLRFLRIYFLTPGKLRRTNMCDCTKFQQNRPEDFGDIAIFRFSRWPLSAILDFDFFNFSSTIRLGGLICNAVQNFTKIGQTVAEISHLTILKMAAVCHLGF